MVDVVRALNEYNLNVDVHDPWVNPDEASEACGITLTETIEPTIYDAVVIAVAHDCFIEMGSAGIKHFAKPQHVLFDVKNVLPKHEVTAGL